MKRRRSLLIALTLGLLAAGSAGYSLSLLLGPSTTIANSQVVNGGATLVGASFTARESRVGPPVYRLRTNLASTVLEAENWNEYR